MFSDFFEELFVKSKFGIYNNYIKPNHYIALTIGGSPMINFEFKSDYPFTLSQRRILPPEIAKQEENKQKADYIL